MSGVRNAFSCSFVACRTGLRKVSLPWALTALFTFDCIALVLALYSLLPTSHSFHLRAISSALPRSHWLGQEYIAGPVGGGEYGQHSTHKWVQHKDFAPQWNCAQHQGAGWLGPSADLLDQLLPRQACPNLCGGHFLHRHLFAAIGGHSTHHSAQSILPSPALHDTRHTQ